MKNRKYHSRINETIWSISNSSSAHVLKRTKKGWKILRPRHD